MKSYPTFSDVDLSDLSKDLNNAIYMLHYVDENIFSKEDVKEACFSVKVALNSIEAAKTNKSKQHP